MGQEASPGVDVVRRWTSGSANGDGAFDAGTPTGAGITVCIIDSGLYTGHGDCAANSSRITGYLSGWDTDRCGHGTWPDIAAVNNGLGVIGADPNVALHRQGLRR